MGKPKSNKRTRRVEIERQFQKPVGPAPKQKQHVKVEGFRQDVNQSFLDRFLIVCEGPTEYSYFEGLCQVFDVRLNYHVVVLPENKQVLSEGYMGSSAKGLLYEAMKHQKTERSPFDKIWIVTDNDEGNSYKLDEASLNRIKTIVPSNIYERLKSFHYATMYVRADEKKNGEAERVRYFLSHNDYKEFLKMQVLSVSELHFLENIIENTTKKNEFRDLFEGRRRAFFYDEAGGFLAFNNKGEKVFEEKHFDENLLNSIDVAYSCISFEHFLLLHFEINTHPFYNSREIIQYFDAQKYFDCAFEKGYYLYDLLKSGNPTIKAFFKNARLSITNNVLLNTDAQPQITGGKKFYEVNPYSNVYRLSTALLNKQNMSIGFLEKPVSFRNLKDIHISNKSPILISFVFDRNKPILKREIEPLFSLMDVNHNPIKANIKIFNPDEPIRKGDNVQIEIALEQIPKWPFFLFFKELDKGVEHTLVWAIIAEELED